MVYTTANSKREELRHDKCGDLLKITCVRITYLLRAFTTLLGRKARTVSNDNKIRNLSDATGIMCRA